MANAVVATAANGQTTNNWKTVGGRQGRSKREIERERGDTLRASCAHLKFPLKTASHPAVG